MKRTFLALAVLFGLLASTLSAQTTTASITGAIHDPSGAVIPGVKVTATNVATNLSYSANTNESGVYNLLFLPVGQYTVSSENQGFKKTVLGPFTLEVNQIARVDIIARSGRHCAIGGDHGISRRFCRRNRRKPAIR